MVLCQAYDPYAPAGLQGTEHGSPLMEIGGRLKTLWVAVTHGTCATQPDQPTYLTQFETHLTQVGPREGTWQGTPDVYPRHRQLAPTGSAHMAVSQ